jgi:hypothetical protein
MPNPLVLAVMTLVAGLIGGLIANAIPTLMGPKTPSAAEIIEQKFKEYENLVKQHADIESILSLLAQLKQNPRLIEQIKTFPDYLVAGAALHRVKQLTAQHEGLMKRLTQDHDYYNTWGGDRTKSVAEIERNAAHVWQQLVTAHADAVKFGVDLDAQSI